MTSWSWWFPSISSNQSLIPRKSTQLLLLHSIAGLDTGKARGNISSLGYSLYLLHLFRKEHAEFKTGSPFLTHVSPHPSLIHNDTFCNPCPGFCFVPQNERPAPTYQTPLPAAPRNHFLRPQRTVDCLGLDWTPTPAFVSRLALLGSGLLFTKCAELIPSQFPFPIRRR